MIDRYESRATTHADDCWSWGPAHYDCAVQEIERLREALFNAAEPDVAPPVPSTPTIRAIFETVGPRPHGLIGTKDAPIKRVMQEDDGVFTVVIDHWPS